MKLLPLSGILLLIICLSCGKGKQTTSKAAHESTAPMILFVNYSIHKDKKGNPEISLINKIITEGQLKDPNPQHHDPKSGDLWCVQSEDGSNPLQSTLIPNPLLKTIEYADDFGNLAKKQIELDTAVFSVRMQLDPSTKYLLIQSTDEQNISISKDQL